MVTSAKPRLTADSGCASTTGEPEDPLGRVALAAATGSRAASSANAVGSVGKRSAARRRLEPAGKQGTVELPPRPNALNSVRVTGTRDDGPTADAQLTANCGDGLRDIGDLDASGTLTAVFPHATCDLRVTDGPYVSLRRDVAIAGDMAVEFSSFQRNTPAAECDFERGSAVQSRAAFEDQYATNHNSRNTFGQCVFQKARR
jgi:hypothetical protein